MKNLKGKIGLFLAALMFALAIAPGANVFAGGSSGGSGSGYVSPSPDMSWTLPALTKSIISSGNHGKFNGKVFFDVEVTLDEIVFQGRPEVPREPSDVPPKGEPMYPGDVPIYHGDEPISPRPRPRHPDSWSKTQKYSRALSVAFSGNEIAEGNIVSHSFDVNQFAHDKVRELEKEVLSGYEGKLTQDSVVYYQRIIVKISESEGSAPGLNRVSPSKNEITMTVSSPIQGPPFVIYIGNYVGPGGGGQPPLAYGPGSMPAPPRPAVTVEWTGSEFINRYTPPNEPNEPECPDDGCCSGCCPDINININNQNNSSANNNNTNVGRDQYNGNQGINPNLKLDRLNHFAYVHGYPDHSFRPEGSITRGEMTAIFRRLLDQGTFMGGSATQFRDVRAGDWYASDVARLSSLGVISGYPDGSFRPNASVTRAEFAAVASKFAYAKSGQGFSDVNGHWAQSAIEKLRNAGWITGYGDGSFRPDSVITRAEVVSITNRMLDRVADANYIQQHQGSLAQYNDLPTGHWAYLPIMEASNAHDYIRNADGSETWTRHWK